MTQSGVRVMQVIAGLAMMASTAVYGDLSNDVSVQFTATRPRYDAPQRRFVVAGRLTNDSEAPVQAPISLYIKDFDPVGHSVALLNPDGSLPNGKYYKVVFGQGELQPGGQADFQFELQFANPVSAYAVDALEKVAQKAFKIVPVTEARLSFTYGLIRIPAGNRQPVADAGADRAGAIGIPVVLDGGFSSDDDGDTLRFSWMLNVRPQGSQAQLANPETASPTLTADLPGTYQAGLTVSDGYVLSQMDSVTITIAAVAGINQPPKITSSPVVSATATRNYSYQIKAGDPDGDELTYKLTTAPSGMTVNATGSVQWLVPDTPHENVPVTIEVDDGNGGLTEQKFSIHIMPCTCS